MADKRDAAFKVLLKIEKESSFSNLALKEEASADDFVRRLVYGVLENKLYLDYFLDKILSKGVSGTKPEVLVILRLGLYQLEFMDSVPDYAAVNSSVSLAKKYVRGMEKLVNGVLRNWTRRKSEIPLPDPNKNLTEYLSVKYSFAPEIIDIILKQRGEDAESILRGITDSSKEGTIDIRINVFKAMEGGASSKDKACDETIEKLKALGLKVERSELSERAVKISKGDGLITEEELFRNGFISIQSEESCWIADSVGASSGDKVLDLCSAPGGKTCAMAEAMLNKGSITACDLHLHRLKLVENSSERLGLSIIKTMEIDATDANSMEKIQGTFDRVLVDAPCSGLGVTSSKPEIKLRRPETESLTKIQASIIENAGRKVKAGGKLVYSTCTIDKRENEDIIEKFLSSNRDFNLEWERTLLPGIDSMRHGFYVAVMTRE